MWSTGPALAVLAVGSWGQMAMALDNGLGRTPPLGWSSWNYFATHINETVIMEMADAMVSTGMAKIGYEYINVDAGYLTRPRDSTGNLVVDETNFPSGIRHLADHVHAKGLKLGVYTDLTDQSCGHGPGSGGHYKADAEQFAAWEVDYLKVDYCGNSVPREPTPSYAAFAQLRDAVNATNRSIYYSICPRTTAPDRGTGSGYHGGSIYAPPPVWTKPQRLALANSILVEYTNSFDLWYADPTPRGDGGAMKVPGGILTNIDSVGQMTELSYSVPGSWNDADMLQLCTFGEGATRHWNSTGLPDDHNGIGLTFTEYQAHLSVWAIMASPLIHSADLRTVGARHPECLDLMLNVEILAINQDPAGFSPQLVSAETNATGKTYEEVDSTRIVAQTWSRRLSGGRVAVLLFNRGEASRRMSVTWKDVGLGPSVSVTVRDVVRKEDLPKATGSFGGAVASHGVLFVVLAPAK